MKLKGLILILIILMSSFSFCNAESLIYDPVIKNNNDQLPTNTTTTPDTFKAFTASTSLFGTSLPDTTMSFEECMDYLVLGNTPTYILVTGNVSNPRNARYTISEGKPANYHSINDNFYDAHFKSLTDPVLNGTLFYTPDNDFNLRTQFLTDSNDKIDLVNYTILKQSIRNTQYITPATVNPPNPDWDSEDDLFKKLDSDPVGVLNQVTVFCHQVGIEAKKSFTYYQIEIGKVYAHNQVVSKARSNVSSKYWEEGYWKIFSDVDDNGLLILNIQYQTIKEPLKWTEWNIEGVILKFDWTIAALDTSNNFLKYIPVVGPVITTVVDNVKLALIFGKLSVQQIKLDKISKLYIDSDAMTWKISSEKDYRELIRKGVIEPNKPTQSDIDLFNNQMDTKIDTLNSGRTLQYNRIFNNSDVNDLNNSYQAQIKYLKDTKDTYDAYPNWAGGCPQYVIDYLDQFNGFYNDINNIVWLNDLEKQLYPTFDSQIDAQIDAINKDKY